MSIPSDRARQEGVVRRLRELHESADEEDQPRAALLLGLALADLVRALPGDDPARAERAAEGVARLAECAAGTSAAVEAARDSLAAAAPGPDPGPASFPLTGGNLNWDMDWGALREMSEAGLRLHYHLQLGRGPADALRRAQPDLLRPGPGLREALDEQLAAPADARFRHPAAWAGFVHHGVDRAGTDAAAPAAGPSAAGPSAAGWSAAGSSATREGGQQP